MKPITLIVEIRGGVLYAVRVLDEKNPDISVIVKDHDNIEAGDPDPLEGIDPSRLVSVF